MQNKAATRIADRRIVLGLSRKTLAELIGTNETQIWRYETGKNDPTAEVLYKLCEVLKTSCDWLLGLTDSMEVYDPKFERVWIKARLPGTQQEFSVTSNAPMVLDTSESEILNLLHQKDAKRRQEILEILRLL